MIIIFIILITERILYPKPNNSINLNNYIMSIAIWTPIILPNIIQLLIVVHVINFKKIKIKYHLLFI